MKHLSFRNHAVLDNCEELCADPAPIPRRVRKIALIGNSLPRRCGIATYTTDIFQAISDRFPDVAIDLWAMNDGPNYAYPAIVSGIIDQDNIESYRLGAREIMASAPDMVWLQHEFGIFGGKAGDYILTLIDRLTVPVAVALHTVLSEPNRDQRRVTQALVDRCETIIVMAEEGRRILIECYAADPAQIVVIAHGIPDRPFTDTAPMKAKLGLAGRDVIMTFGLLSAGKGIETVIAAMPAVIAQNPDALYLVVGATHPHAIGAKGESYRTSLTELVKSLGVSAHVRFINTFFATDDILDYLAAADIYVTPYLNPAQVTSGTLAYAVGLGKPIISTPYVHAKELLGGGYGHLVDFRDTSGFADHIIALLGDPVAMMSMRKKTYALGRTMIWPRLAEASMLRFEQVAARTTAYPIPLRQPNIPRALPLNAIARMSDATGILQHSIFGVPDRAHGYCIDDNARALMLFAKMPNDVGPQLRTAFAAFVEQAWNPENGRFRNFMSYQRDWLEDVGSDDSCGRTLWALGVTAAQPHDAELAAWARALFDRAHEPLSVLQSPRTQAFMMLGALATDDPDFAGDIIGWAETLCRHLNDQGRPGWDWFEPELAYDNARLPEALLRAGHKLGRPDFVEIGIATLTWLMAQQASTDGHFRAVGSDSFGRRYAPPLPFDQQPVEAWATIDACDAAFDATGNQLWPSRAVNTYRWFLGKNELAVAVANVESGECFDGLIPTGVNRNRGAESVLAFHHATYSIQRHRFAAC